jgi:hypothetical protein
MQNVPKTTKNAAAFLRRGKVFVQAYLPTTSGVLIGSGLVYIALTAEEDAAHEALRAALSLPYQILRHPQQNEWKSLQQPMLQAVGAKSWKLLAKGALFVDVSLSEDTVKFTPTAHYEQDGGSALNDMVIEINRESPKLGRALLDAFELCK